MESIPIKVLSRAAFEHMLIQKGIADEKPQQKPIVIKSYTWVMSFVMTLECSFEKLLKV